MLVAVSGTIGAGKSTLCTQLGAALGFDVVPEPVLDNPYLGDFYADPERWAFASQVFMVTHRFRRYLDVSGSPDGFLLDRCIFEDHVFAEVCRDMGYLTRREWDTYCALQEAFLQVVEPPTVVVYLRVSPETAARRIAARGRSVESAVGIDYLRRLHDAYERWADKMRAVTEVIEVDWSAYGDPTGILDRLPKAVLEA
jgi:deoxyadenosine kinase